MKKMSKRNATWRAKKPQSSPISKLPREEWDFSECPVNQKQHCLDYELARESEKAIRLVKEARETGWKLTGLFPMDERYYSTNRWVSFYSALPQFPESPWLQIPPKVRREALNAVAPWEGPFMSIDPSRLFDEDGEYQDIPRDTGFLELTSVHAIEVDWTASDDSVRASFDAWLARNRPTELAVKETRGRTDAFEQLRFLGAYRLLRHYGNGSSAADAVSQESVGRHAPDYKDESSWNRARRQADHLIKHGYIPGPSRRAVQLIDKSELTRIEKAKAKVYLSMQSKTEQRRLAKLKARQLLDELKERFAGGA